MIVSIIAAYSEPGWVIGRDGRMPWRLPADLARFKALTMGHTLLLGRRTYESLDGRELPGRRIIVLTRDHADQLPRAVSVAGSLDAGLALANQAFEEDELFLAGGGTVYQEALKQGLVDRMYLTLVEADLSGDTFFPQYHESQWREIVRQDFPADDANPYPTAFRFLKRRAVS